MRIDQAAVITDPGTARDDNEDAVLALEAPPVLAVADGMGGSEPGLIASTFAVEVVRHFSDRLTDALQRIVQERSTANRLALSDLFDELFNTAGREIHLERNERKATGMGSTLLMASVVGSFAYIAHVGNSRAYLVRDGHMTRLTEDHSLAEFRFRRGRLSREEYEKSNERHVLYQALGTGVDVEVDVAEVRLMDGDILLLCSDGLTRALTEEEIGKHLGRDVNKAARALLRAANRSGAEDNVSIAIARVAAEPDDEPIEAITDSLRDVFLFRDLTAREVLVIAPFLEEQVYKKGAVIVSEGEPGDVFYVIVSGKARVTRGSTHLIDVGKGEHFGELALARPVKRSATVSAVNETRVFGLSRDRFKEVLKQKPELGAKLAMALLDTVGDRLRDISDRLNAVERAVRGDLK